MKSFLKDETMTGIQGEQSEGSVSTRTHIHTHGAVRGVAAGGWSFPVRDALHAHLLRCWCVLGALVRAGHAGLLRRVHPHTHNYEVIHIASVG